MDADRLHFCQAVHLLLCPRGVSGRVAFGNVLPRSESLFIGFAAALKGQQAGSGVMGC